jgi:hypothetical protein
VTSSPKKWSGEVKTVSTYPPEGLFTKDAGTIARQLASKKSLAERSWIGDADADFLYQLRGKGA